MDLQIIYLIEFKHLEIVFRDFLNEVDIREGEIERTVTTMVRLKAIDHNSPKKGIHLLSRGPAQ